MCYKCGGPRGRATQCVELAHRRGVWSCAGWVSANSMDALRARGWEPPDDAPRILTRERPSPPPGQAQNQAARPRAQTPGGQRAGTRHSNRSSSNRSRGRADSQNRGKGRHRKAASGARGSAETEPAGETIAIGLSQQVAALTEEIHRLSLREEQRVDPIASTPSRNQAQTDKQAATGAGAAVSNPSSADDFQWLLSNLPARLAGSALEEQLRTAVEALDMEENVAPLGAPFEPLPWKMRPARTGRRIVLLRSPSHATSLCGNKRPPRRTSWAQLRVSHLPRASV